MLDSTNESFSVLSPDGDGWTVRQGGPVLLWDEAVRSVALWHTAGAPGLSEFGVSVTAGSQRVWLGTPSGPSWPHTVGPGYGDAAPSPAPTRSERDLYEERRPPRTTGSQ